MTPFHLHFASLSCVSHFETTAQMFSQAEHEIY